MKHLFIFIFVCFASCSAFAQINEAKVSALESNLKRLEKVSQELKSRTIVIQDSIRLIESQITNEKFASLSTNEVVCITKNGVQARLRDIPSTTGNEVTIIPKNKSIEVLEYMGDSYWKVRYNKFIGYLNEVFLSQTEEMKYAIKKFEENKNISDKNEMERINQLSLKHDKAELERLKAQYGNEDANRILRHSIWIGMTDDMATKSIGTPKAVNKSVGSWGIHEQWVYEKKFLYFENGKLTSWQEE